MTIKSVIILKIIHTFTRMNRPLSPLLFYFGGHGGRSKKFVGGTTPVACSKAQTTFTIFGLVQANCDLSHIHQVLTPIGLRLAFHAVPI